MLVVCLVVAVSAVVVTAYAGGIYDYTPEELTGPEQPIEFNHQIHAGAVGAGNLGIPCLYCHGAAELGQHATVPAVSVCMGCHAHVKEGRTPGSAEQLTKLREYHEKGQSIPWVRIHDLPEYVQFKHMRHVRAGIECQTCHGDVQDMKRVYFKNETQFTRRSLWVPTAKFEMGWCMECHLERGAPDDCAACHY